VRTGHTAAFLSLDLRKAGAKTLDLWAQGGAATEQVHVHGTYAKAANQRLSYCRWCWLLPKCQNAVFWHWHSESPQTHNTRTATHCRHHDRPVFLPGSSLASFGKPPAARRNQDGPTTPPQNGGQRQERHLGRSWWSLEWHVSSSGRALLPAVRHPTKPAKSSDAKKVNMCLNAKHIYSPYLVALCMGVIKGP
jgi:hypothetical protein